MEKELVHSYIAGIIDGEGTIGIRKFKNSTGQLHYRPMIEVYNSSKTVIDLLVDTFGNSSYFYKRGLHYKRNGGIYTWRVTGTKCSPVLSAVMPHLRIKNRQAELCLQFVKTIGKSGEKWTEQERATKNNARSAWYEQSRFLNSSVIL